MESWLVWKTLVVNKQCSLVVLSQFGERPRGFANTVKFDLLWFEAADLAVRSQAARDQETEAAPNRMPSEGTACVLCGPGLLKLQATQPDPIQARRSLSI